MIVDHGLMVGQLRHCDLQQIHNMKKISSMTRVFVLMTFPLIVVLLTGCGSSDEQQAAAQQMKVKKVIKQVKPADPLAGLNSAVTGSSGTLPVDLRFELLDRPQPGKPGKIRLVFVPAIDLYAIHAVIKPSAGMEMADGADVKFDAPKKDELKDYQFAVTPSSTGIYLVNVDVTVTRDTGDTVFNFSLPVPVPDGPDVPEANTAPPAAPPVASASSSVK